MSNTKATDQESSFSLRAAGHDWVIERTADLESLWDEMDDEEFGPDERIPYWTEIWPASLALSDWLASREELIRGALCVDLGCGLGLTSMAGCRAGASVLCLDYEFEAVSHARRNALINGLEPPLATLMDWRSPALKEASVDFIWGSDVLYERRFAPAVARFLDHALKPGGRAWLADPGRNFFAEFETVMAGLPMSLSGREKLVVPWRGRDVNIWIHEFSKVKT